MALEVFRHDGRVGVSRVRAALGSARKAVEVGVLRLALGMLVRLGPVRASDWMGGLFRRLGPLLPVTRVAEVNLRMALPELDRVQRRRVIRDMWEGLGRTAGEFPHLADLPENSPSGPGWEVVNSDRLVAHAATGEPAIFVSGHIGNWEMLPVVTSAYGMPFASVYRRGTNEGVDDIVLTLRRRAMKHDIPSFAKGARGAREAMAHIKSGGYLALLVDQKMNDGVAATLFGLPAMTAPAAAALALRFRCAVIPGHVERVGPARFRLTVGDFLALPETGDRQANILSLTQAINDCLERWIRERPHSWLWLHRRFAKSLYRRGRSLPYLEEGQEALPPGPPPEASL